MSKSQALIVGGTTGMGKATAQLLLKQGITVPYEDLNYLKTPNRLREHDEIYKTCCNILNWNFMPMS